MAKKSLVRDLDKFMEILTKEIMENLPQTLIEGLIKEGKDHAQKMAGNRYKIDSVVNLDADKSRGTLSSDSPEAMEIEEKEHILKKTVGHITKPSVINKILKEFKRCTDDFKPKGA